MHYTSCVTSGIIKKLYLNTNKIFYNLLQKNNYTFFPYNHLINKCFALLLQNKILGLDVYKRQDLSLGGYCNGAKRRGFILLNIY